MKITGQILKSNRERKQITLSEVSLSTKITIKTLVSIEDGDPANLPPKTFLRGFVRSYAIYLGLDGDEILRTFHEEMGSTLSRPILTNQSSTDTSTQDSPSEINAGATEAAAKTSNSGNIGNSQTSSTVRDAEARLNNEPSLAVKGSIGAGILLLIFLIIFFKNKMNSYESERANAPSIVQKTAEPPVPPAPTPDVAPIPSASATATATATATASPTPSSSPTASPSPAASPSPSPSPTASPTPKPSPSPSPSPSPTATPTPVKPGSVSEILIEALDAVDIEVTIDGEPPKTLKLKADQVQTIKAKRKAVLKLSDGGAVNVVVNGVDKGVPGDLGKPKNVELP